MIVKTALLTLIAIWPFVCPVLSQHVRNCGIDRFTCANGDCIKSELLCDGKADCKDKSDETQAECTRPEIICPDRAFRCAYGACVDGDARCNGVKDCIDNSDETLPECRGIVSVDASTAAPCPTDYTQCNNGRCINETKLCDGHRDCSDGSDETYQKCASLVCPPTVFQCRYGACIDGDLKCNGVSDCADGSDEEAILCRSGGSTGTTSTESTTYTPSPWTPKTTRPCIVPQQPENGHWKLHRSQCADGQDCEVEQGTVLYPGAYLIYSCNRGYKVKGTVDVFCSPDGKWLNVPVCERVQCKSLNSASTRATCSYNSDWRSCDSPVLPGTVAQLECRNSYRQDTTLLSRQRTRVRCGENGQWAPEPIRCVPVCGVTNPGTTPLIVNGTQANIAEFPWHATLYRQDVPDGPKEFICGATIIQANLLITAAHCVYDESNQRVYNATKFLVLTGNIFRDYDSPFHNQRFVKRAMVKNIYVICTYLGIDGNYASDIALMELTRPFVFSATLVPACLDVTTFSDQTVLEVGNKGKVAGFGRTALGPSSAVLQTIEVPYVALSQCKSSSFMYDTGKYITLDKFCAGYTNGSSVCDGDSGGGLVFKSGGLWYLRGIVSVALGSVIYNGVRSCDSHTYSLYTKVSVHITWVQDVIFRLETRQPFPPCERIAPH